MKALKKGLAVFLTTVLLAEGAFAGCASAKAKPSLSQKKITLKVGKTKKLKVKNLKKKAKVTWKSSKKKVATVSKKGVVKARKKGKAVITAKFSYKKKPVTLKCQVTVKKAADAPDASDGGTEVDLPADPTAEPTQTPVPYGEAGKAAAYDADKSNYALNIDASNKVHGISDMLYGIFIEDINFAADGGLYAEMVQNRSFEFAALAAGDEKHAWSDVGDVKADVVKDDAAGALNKNNPNYMVIENTSGKEAGIENTGFLDGMSVVKDAGYKFSVYARGLDGYTGKIQAEIVCGDRVLAQGEVPAVSSEWKKYELELKASETAYNNVRLRLTIPNGKLAVDMVSLFPKDTYKGRENGLRKDLAEKLAALKPKFLRFPGGCVAEGVSLDKAYDWKDSIGVDADGEPLMFNGHYGDVAARKLGQNIWTDERATNDKNPCYMTYGLGFYEYFQLAEDLGAVGVPVINCGMCCMIQGNGSGPAVDSAEFKQYVQDALDLVEFCRGDASTKWGAVRISMGHEKPFALKYIGIGNEQWGSRFFERYEAFVDAFDKAKKEKPELYGDIELMFTAGADDGDSGADYMGAYKEAEKWLKAHPDKTIADFAGTIDHHYYNTPDWFLKHTDYYDEANYSRDTAHMTDSRFGGGINVFLGEYAAQSNTLEAALAEAAYMTGLERNGDIVRMAAYAPLFGNLTAMHWAPDLIWFNNHTSTCSINYYMQKLFANNAGSELLKSELTGATAERQPFAGRVGVGTWSTSASFDNAKVVDNATGNVLAEEDFSDEKLEGWTKAADGTWKLQSGKLVQTSTRTDTNKYANTGSALYWGDANWKNYTFTVDAVKNGGSEGFMIPFSVGDKDNNYFWNIGGWNNTVSCLQQVKNGVKSDQLAGTVRNINIKTGQTYHLKVVVTDWNVKCYLNDTLYVDCDVPETAEAESYQVVSTDETGDIIVKLVNVTGAPRTFAIDLANAGNLSGQATVQTAAGNSLKDDNILEKEEAVNIKESQLSGLGSKFNYTVPKYSATVLRIS